MAPLGTLLVEPIGSVYVKTHLVHHLRMKRTDPQFKLRIPEELKARIDEAAKESRRSINAEIIARLEQSFPRSASFPLPPKLAEQIATLDRQVAEIMRSKMMQAIDEAIDEALNNSKKP